MKHLFIPAQLKMEFATVGACWNSQGATRRVDSLVLSWVKYEKQLRRLFCFLIFQHPKIDGTQIDKVISMLAKNRRLYPETFIKGIAALGVRSVPALLGQNYKNQWKEISRIKKYRNKLIHGQITGQKIQSSQLERDVIHIVAWVYSLAQAAEAEFGYDGLGRNTFRKAKGTSRIVISQYPFSNVTELKQWLNDLVG